MKTKYKITVFRNRFKTDGELKELTFEQLYLKFRNHVRRTKEKFIEYTNADKQTKANIKDVGGFIGGTTEGNKRTNDIKIIRTLLTLDIDTKYPNVLEYLERNVTFYGMVHSTHSHSPNENRYRIIAPLSREVTPDEYEALGRRIAYSIENTKNETFKGLFDETTFQANRLMFFPSVSCDGEYICKLINYDLMAEEQPIIDVDKILEEYVNKNDIFEWFTPEIKNVDLIGANNVLNKNPLKAKGMVGAFNRTYSITQAIKKFLPNIYKEGKHGRYTYINGGSFNGGLVLNEDTIFYSHHGTDPANLYYRSAFDLVRIHLFGAFDNGFTPEKLSSNDIFEKTDSFAKMVEFCRNLPEVIANSDNNLALQQKLEKQEKHIFGEEEEIDIKKLKEEVEEYKKSEEQQEEPEDTDTEQNNSWLVKLEGEASMPGKLEIIFSNDRIIGNLLFYNEFKEDVCLLRQPYWVKDFEQGSSLTDRDMSHIRNHLNKVYDIKNVKVIEDNIVVVADKIQKNPMLEFFETLVWDGEERLETFFPTFFKTPINPFTKVAFKHWMVGAVSRVYKKGSPMDLLLIIKGEQGIGKSLFFKRLATNDFSKPEKHLYSDTKINFETKDGFEQLDGVWIYEWKELAGLNMSEQEAIKAFIDKTEDKYRRSYGRRMVEVRRRVAFGGTTNEKQPLRDRSGNRRFLVYESGNEQFECYINDDKLFNQYYKDQLIAEAIHLYKKGFNIFKWTKEELEWWEKSNDENLAENDFLGSIEAYLNMKKPRNWYSLSKSEMLFYMDEYDFANNKSGSELDAPDYHRVLDYVCVGEIWQIALRQRDLTINRYHRDLIYQALNKCGWTKMKNQRLYGFFGKQYGFEKIKKEDEFDRLEDLPF